METLKQRILETADFISERIHQLPVIGLLTGTGLAQSADAIQIQASLAYEQLPNFPVSTVESHTGRLLIGEIQGKPIMAMQGRFHLYEGYSAVEVTFPIRVMQELGVSTLIISNAAGALNLEFETGDIMLIADHINLTGENPLVGPHDDRWGMRFPDMSAAYDPAMISLAAKTAAAAGIRVRKGVYAGLKGPSLETPAEIRFLKLIGADAVGLSTIQEVIVAVQAGMRILGLSIITNINNPDEPAPDTLDEIIAVANSASPKLEQIIRGVIGDLE